MLLPGFEPSTSVSKTDIQANRPICSNVQTSAGWQKVVLAIDIFNNVIQARDASLDVKMYGIETFLGDFMKLRSNRKGIRNEVKEATLNLRMDFKFCHERGHVDRKRQRMHDENIVVFMFCFFWLL